MSLERLSSSRRTVVRGAAWSAPAVALTTAAPAFASTGTCDAMQSPSSGTFEQPADYCSNQNATWSGNFAGSFSTSYAGAYTITIMAMQYSRTVLPDLPTYTDISGGFTITPAVGAATSMDSTAPLQFSGHVDNYVPYEWVQNSDNTVTAYANEYRIRYLVQGGSLPTEGCTRYSVISPDTSCA